ncbi:carboxypeptidase-like regulatory domain-containing protein [Flavobacterium sp.]|uniref:carboxypeptidase-like regulatory domain-containing protein n=2 Tax=Flavobacterium sp. TaxID=239 RepID=UPI004047BF82
MKKTTDKRKKKYLYFILFLFVIPYLSRGQNTIQGTVVTDSLTQVENVNIIIKDIKNGSILKFTNTNNEGFFKIEANLPYKKYIIRLSALGYKTTETEFEISSSITDFKKIVLEKNIFELKEVVLEAKKKAIIVKGDTTAYNINYFTNGTEDNLKDLLNNLPGISVNENGKIVVDGKEINELLIDGENLYNKQHQFATKNLSSKAVKSIETYKNYTSFDKLKTSEQSGQTALNVLIKDEYKNNFKGTIQADYDFVNRYKINSTLYHFSKKNKFSLIQNSNNLGENSIDFKDYFSLIDNENENNNKSSNVVFSTLDDVPNFLKIGENVLKTNNNFSTISNVYSPSKKTKISFYSIVNFSDIKEKIISNQSYINSGIEFKENININEKNTFNIFNLKSVFKPNKNTIFKLTNSLLIDNINNIETIENFSQGISANINQNNVSKKNIFQNNFNFSKKINKNFLTASVFFDFTELNFKNNIDSNQPFLNLNFPNSFIFEQFYKKINKKTGYDVDYSFDIKRVNIKLKTAFYTNLFYFNNQSNSHIDYKNFYKTKNNNHINQINLNYDFSKKINFNLTLNHNLTNQKVNDLEKYENTFFGYNAALKYSFKPNTFLQISKSLTNNLSDPENLIENYFVKNYRSIFQNSNLKPNSIFPSNKLNLTFFKFNQKTNSVLILNINHIYTNETVGYNYINNSNFNISQYKIIPKEELTTVMLFIEEKLKNKPFNLSINIDYNNTKKAFFINNTLSNFESNYISSTFNLKSTFKKSPIHFNLGYNYAINLFNNNNTKTKLTTFQPYLSINGLLFKNLNWKIHSIHSTFKTDNSNRAILNISPTLRYSKSDFWEFYVSGNNIINLKSTEIISNNSDVGYNMQTITATLAGYINVGIKYNF